jgi:hypothetical protein
MNRAFVNAKLEATTAALAAKDEGSETQEGLFKLRAGMPPARRTRATVTLRRRAPPRRRASILH